jgi:hypothetical protein
MPIQDNILMLLSDNVLQAVFKEIVKNRSAIFKDLMGSVSGRTNVASDQIERALIQLQNADLIKTSESSIKDFNSYYPTAEGPAAERQLRLTVKESSAPWEPRMPRRRPVSRCHPRQMVCYRTMPLDEPSR